jgi:uncharacterized protein (TIGR01777 family)
MKVAVTGASGLVGRALTARLGSDGHHVVRLVRRADPGRDEVSWDPASGGIDANQLAGIDAMVHLAGENIAGLRWNAKVKRAIRDSRVDGTRAIAEAVAGMDRKPDVLVCASAIGFYGDRGDEELVEESAPGEGYLPDVCREWEEAAQPARDAGIRVVHLRIGVVLAADGGALDKMLAPFRLGVGGVIGNGRQFMSWIALDDVCGAIEHVLATPGLEGPVNTVAPGAVTNREFTKTLGTVLVRPTILPIPGIGARVAFGEMAGPLLLGSTRVVPAKLSQTGYRFEHPKLEGALRAVLGR